MRDKVLLLGVKAINRKLALKFTVKLIGNNCKVTGKAWLADNKEVKEYF